MSDDILLHGFAIGGFRSFVGPPQRIGPLGKVTVIAGPNNSGKSNVLQAAARLVPHFADSRVPPHLIPLDWPDLGPGAELPRLSVGIAVPTTSPHTPREAIRTRVHGQTGVIRQYSELEVESLLTSIEAVVTGGKYCWLQRELRDQERWRPAHDQAQALAEQALTRGVDLGRLSGALLGRSSSDAVENAAGFLDALYQGIDVPAVHVVPAIRAIAVSDAVADAPDASGRGLPKLLLALQAPVADRYREDTRRYEQINDFVQSVLERPDARILVPHNTGTVHISIGDTVHPLENLGSGLAELVLLATIATWYEHSVICIEEPELHLHPVMLRRLVHYLRTATTNQYLIATHSAHLLDDPNVTVLRTSWDPETGTTVTPAVTPAQRAEVSQHLGFRPSDLIQANSVVWVEGPSDRIYLNHWLHLADDRLVEGIHYSIMFYGGRLLAHLTGEPMDTLEEREHEFINLLQINRNMAVVIDSDRAAAGDALNATKERVVAEFQQSGYAWVTAGREIENYVPRDTLAAAVAEVHPKTAHEVPEGPYAKVFDGMGNPDKVRIAEVTVRDASMWDVLDLTDRVGELVAFVRRANGLGEPTAK